MTERVTRSDDVLSGAWRIEGTRIPTSAVYSFWQADYDVHQIIREYPTLTEDDVHAAIEWEEKLRTDGMQIPEIVERVARRLCRLALEQQYDEVSDALVETNWYTNADIYVEQARAAIEALREPTEEMCYASKNIAGASTHHIVWQAMIDAALGENSS